MRGPARGREPADYDSIREMILQAAGRGPVCFKDMCYHCHDHLIEDNAFLRPGERAASNGQLIERLERIGRELGREPATPAEARRLLGIA